MPLRYGQGTTTKDVFVALITKDVNLRMKAKAVGMEAQDYLTDKIDESKIEFTHNEVIVKENLTRPKPRSSHTGKAGCHIRTSAQKNRHRTSSIKSHGVPKVHRPQAVQGMT